MREQRLTDKGGEPRAPVYRDLACVVKGRVFVRAWSVQESVWYRTFLKEPNGAIQVGKQEIQIEAKWMRDTKWRDAIDRAYLEKYKTPGALKCEGFGEREVARY